jgi:transcriptional regulator with XRE-family HTH domain
VQFGKLLKLFRKKQEKTMSEVAEVCGYSTSYISDIEHGRRNPPEMSKVKKIEKFLKVDNNSLSEAATREMNIPKEARRIFSRRPNLNFALLRASENLTEEEVNELIADLQERKQKKDEI